MSKPRLGSSLGTKALDWQDTQLVPRERTNLALEDLLSTGGV